MSSSTRQPEFVPGVPTVTLEPFADMDKPRIEQCAELARLATQHVPTREILRRRNLIGVMNRHLDSKTSAKSADRVQGLMRDGKLGAFVICVNGGWGGIGSVVPDITLRRPRNSAAGVLLPARALRTAGLKLGEEVKTTGPNISAWIAADGLSRLEDSETNYVGVLRQAFELLRETELADGSGWTIEPVVSKLAETAIIESGMPAVAGPERFDDQEVRGFHRVPLSNLFQSNPAT